MGPHLAVATVLLTLLAGGHAARLLPDTASAKLSVLKDSDIIRDPLPLAASLEEPLLWVQKQGDLAVQLLSQQVLTLVADSQAVGALADQRRQWLATAGPWDVTHIQITSRPVTLESGDAPVVGLSEDVQEQESISADVDGAARDISDDGSSLALREMEDNQRMLDTLTELSRLSDAKLAAAVRAVIEAEADVAEPCEHMAMLRKEGADVEAAEGDDADRDVSAAADVAGEAGWPSLQRQVDHMFDELQLSQQQQQQQHQRQEILLQQDSWEETLDSEVGPDCDDGVAAAADLWDEQQLSADNGDGYGPPQGPCSSAMWMDGEGNVEWGLVLFGVLAGALLCTLWCAVRSWRCMQQAAQLEARAVTSSSRRLRSDPSFAAVVEPLLPAEGGAQGSSGVAVSYVVYN